MPVEISDGAKFGTDASCSPLLILLSIAASDIWCRSVSVLIRLFLFCCAYIPLCTSVCRLYISTRDRLNGFSWNLLLRIIFTRRRYIPLLNLIFTHPILIILTKVLYKPSITTFDFITLYIFPNCYMFRLQEPSADISNKKIEKVTFLKLLEKKMMFENSEEL